MNSINAQLEASNAHYTEITIPDMIPDIHKNERNSQK